MLRRLVNKDAQIEILKDHVFFKQLQGNPHSVNLLACLRANPFCKRSLSDLHQLIQSKQIKSLLEEEGVSSVVFSNDYSLRVSTEISLVQLESTSQEAYQFYFFMGLLDAGALPG